MRVPRWAWVIGGLVVAMIVITAVWERADPDSSRVEAIGRQTIPQQTGSKVSDIVCAKAVHITHDTTLKCNVKLADGRLYETTATVRAHRRYANHYSLNATFTPPPGGGAPAPFSGGPSTSPSSGKPHDTDVDKLAACVRAANQDPVKLQECTKRR